MSTVLISLVMPVYNAVAYLAAAIESILTQTQQDIEACLVQYAELLRSRWAQLYSNLWWWFLR